MDFEDSVAAVDASDKVTVYRNWLGLMKGTLTEQVTKSGRTFTRAIATDKTFTGRDGKPASLRGTSLMLARNVGHLMTTSAVLQADGSEMHEGIIDALVTATCALHDLRKSAGKELNCRLGLHRETKNARTSRSAILVRLVHCSRANYWNAAEHAEGRHHGRGAPHFGELKGMHSRSEITCGIH
jgi:hypothetical protein